MGLSPQESITLTALRTRLGERFGARLRDFVLFGSRARGEGHDASDLDVLVLVTDLTASERRDVIDAAYDLELASGLLIEPIVRDAAAWRPDVGLGREIARDGLRL